MASSSYDHLILIGSNSDFEMNKLGAKLLDLYKNKGNTKVEIGAPGIEILIDQWQFSIGLNQEDHVVIESEEIASLFAKKHKLFDQIKACKKRLELSGSSDYDMNYFNDFCYILETIESFNEVFSFNSVAGEFMNI